MPPTFRSSLALKPPVALALAAAAALVCAARTAAQPPGPGSRPTTRPAHTVPIERLSKLTRGVNFSRWFAWPPPDPKRFPATITAGDLAFIRRAGFRHVRLPVAPEVLTDPARPGELAGTRLARFDAALDAIGAEGLAVVVCLFPRGDYKQRVLTAPATTGDYGRGLKALAAHLARRDPEEVFIEILNEPNAFHPTVWNRLQRELLPMARAGAPRHTLIATSNIRNEFGRWDTVGGLEGLEPVDDTNVVYDFHFYDPVQFTHQGAAWMMPQCGHYRNLPYPSSPQAVQPHLFGISDRAAVAFASLYGRERWDRLRLDTQITRAARWGLRYRVPVICGEFGCYRPNAPDDDRLRYLRDVRELLEQHNIGWAVWEYSGGFGVVEDKDGRRVVDRAMLAALGLPGAKDAPATVTTQPAKRPPATTRPAPATPPH